jgi:acyl-coenzyme A synthetase/AMP-(fatty) acid ligase
LENVLLSHKEVKEAVVFPVEDDGGHVPRAVVTIKNTFTTPKSKDKLEKEILDWANGKNKIYKITRQ